MSKEQKNRRRSLMAWVTAIALLLGLVSVPYTEVQAGGIVEGVLLTVDYVIGDAVVKTETYSRHYADDTNTTMEEYVTVTVPDDSVLSNAGGSLLISWEYTDVSGEICRILPGKTMELSWNELLADGGLEAKVTMSAWMQNYTVELEYVGEESNPYRISNLSENEPIELSSEEDYVSVSAPETVPVMDAHSFLGWQLYNGEELIGETDEPGGVFISSEYGSQIPYEKLGDSWTVKALWATKATINFYDDYAHYYEDTLSSAVEIVKQDGIPFEFTTPSIPDTPEEFRNGTFLAWHSLIDDKYLEADETVTYETWPTLPSGYIGTVVGTWLNANYEFGDEEVEDWQGVVFVERVSDTHFTVCAPEVMPKSTDETKYMNGWRVVADDMELTAGVGQALADEEGNPYEFPYERLMDTTLDFTAEWVDLLSTTVTFDLAGGELDGRTEPIVYHQVQGTPEEETFAVTAPPEPTRPGYRFIAWEYSNEHLGANQSTEAYFSYEQPPITFTAVWQQTATVNYVPNPTMIPSYTENVYQNSENETFFYITLPSGDIVEDDQGGEFLVWSGDGLTPYYVLPGSEAEISWETVSGSEGVVTVMAHWLYHNVVIGDVEIEEYNGSAHAIAGKDGFIVYAPEEPEAVVKTEKYFFRSWLAEFEPGQTSYEVKPGEPIAVLREDGETMEEAVFEYENYADSTINFTAQWQKADKATFSFDPAGGIIKEETTPLTTVKFQEESTDTVFTAVMPAAPSYERHIFKGWKYTAEDGTEYVFGANEDTESQNVLFTYGKDTELSFTALWSEIPTESTLILYYDETRSEYMSEKRDILLDDSGTPYTDARLNSGLRKEDMTQLFLGWHHAEKGYAAPGSVLTFVWSEEVYETELVGQWATMQYDFDGVDVKEEMELPSVITSSEEVKDMVKIVMPNTVPGVVETEKMTYTFDGWRVEVLGEVYEEGGIGAEIGDFFVEDLKEATITATALWTAVSKEIVISEGTVELTAEQRYVFPEGNWRIEGDSSIYAGGMAFYVPTTGTYSILRGEE